MPKISFTIPIMVFFLAGGCGAAARYLLSAGVHRICGENFPWGILVVNLLGCFLFGLCFILLERWFPPDVSGTQKWIFLTGFLGAFTTFSTFMFDTVTLLEQAKYMHACANLLTHNVLGIIMIFCGLTVGLCVF